MAADALISIHPSILLRKGRRTASSSLSPLSWSNSCRKASRFRARRPRSRSRTQLEVGRGGCFDGECERDWMVESNWRARSSGSGWSVNVPLVTRGAITLRGWSRGRSGEGTRQTSVWEAALPSIIDESVFFTVEVRVTKGSGEKRGGSGRGRLVGEIWWPFWTSRRRGPLRGEVSGLAIRGGVEGGNDGSDVFSA